MAKAGIILFADTDTAEGTGRLANVLTTAREFQEAGDEVTHPGRKRRIDRS